MWVDLGIGSTDSGLPVYLYFISKAELSSPVQSLSIASFFIGLNMQI
jgi:hypothetical protein